MFDVFPFSDIENELDDILTEGDFDAIEEKVTPKTLTSCTTNALLKAFQVSVNFILTYYIHYI